MSNPSLPRSVPPSTVPSSAPVPTPITLSSMQSEPHLPSDKYDAPPNPPPSALAAVAAAHPLVPPGAPSSSTFHPASSSSRPASLAMSQTMLTNIPFSYSYPLPSLNTLNQQALTTTSVPPIPHHPNPPNTDLHNLACLAQPLANPLTQALNPSHIPHSETAPTTPPPLHQHPIQQHHEPMPTSLSSHPSSLNAAAAAAAVAAVATAERDITSHPDQRNDPNIMHHPSAAVMHPSAPMHSNPLIQASAAIHHSAAMHVNTSMHPPSSAMPSSAAQPPVGNPFGAAPNQPQRQASPTNSEAAEAPSTDGIGAGSTGGGTSTVGAASVDGAGGVSGSSSGNVTEEHGAQHASAAPSPAGVGAVSAPPSSGRRRQLSEVDSPIARPNKRPHRSISHAEKRRLCEISNAHPSAKHGHIATVFLSETGRRIERSTVTRVLQRKDFWMSAGARDSNRKRLTSPRFPTIEEALFELIRNRTREPALRAILTDKELMKYSKDIAEVMRNDSGSMDKNSPNYAPHLRSFRGSLSWVTSFKKRNALMPPEEDKTFPVRPFVSSSLPGETLDIWQTEPDIPQAIETCQEYSRLEDMYFLDAVALAASARPENAAVSTKVAQINYDSTAGIDEAFGIVEPHGQERESVAHDANGHAIPPIEFSMPILTSSTELRYPVDDDTIVYALFCTNGVGNDKRPPWIVGKRALTDMGVNGGEVWPGCPVRYFHNKQGWITGRLTRKWIEEFDKSVDRKVIIVTSLLNACDLELLDLKNVTILPLPRTELGREREAAMSWSSSSASPFHHGIEQMFRVKYRSLVLERALRQMGEQRPLKNLSLKTIAITVKEAWEKVPVPVIRRAWRELPYLPSKFSRNANRPRSNNNNNNNSNKPMWGQTLNDLVTLVRTYREAIPSYNYAEEIELRQSDVSEAETEVKGYIWLPAEENLFHPSGSILEFARSACADTPAKDDCSEQGNLVKPAERGAFQIENHKDALDLINKLADFIRSDPSLGNEHNLYLAGSLQHVVKKECDRRQNEADERNWIEANRQRTSGLP